MDHKGERVDIKIIDIVTFEHINRYLFAENFVSNKVVLDIACGTGYGSYFLSNKAKYVYAIDINAEVIETNKKKYIKDNLEFVSANAESIPLQDKSIDVVISYETIEHLNNPQSFLSEVKRVLKDSGLLVISTPNKKMSEINNIQNPFHVKEFYREEFCNLISSYFKFQQLLYQFSNVNLIMPAEKENLSFKITDVNIDKILKEEVIKPNPFEVVEDYFIIVASDIDLQQLNTQYSLNMNLCIKYHLLQKDELINRIYKSYNYKIGFYITYPIKKLLHILKIKSYPEFQK
ncbi:MAG: class I SAM-dependent methyltransferase [Bacteroidales bacterium]|nr:class I SAM-dependent methyltransferase [Bacteroidales bacterium]